MEEGVMKKLTELFVRYVYMLQCLIAYLIL